MKHSDLQAYFIERFTELLHKDTLDSYRVRTHNALSAIKELKELLEAWLDNRIKQFDTVKLCAEEVRDIIEIDTALSFNFLKKTLFISELSGIIKGIVVSTL